MAEFAGDLASFKPSLPFIEMDPNMDLINQFGELNQSLLEHPHLNNMGFCNDNFLAQQQPEFPVNYLSNLPWFPYVEGPNAVPGPSQEHVNQGNKKQKLVPIPDTSSGNSSTQVIENGLGVNNKTKRKNTSGRGKRGKNNEKETEKPKEVIHVRARRGQATDSHSLAERVRREKINEKLRCLQDLVPGCYKTMGMAVMLDEIITYVQSLQNQVEFLSMKLTAASNFYDFNSDMEVTQTMQGTNAYEAQEMEKLVREGGYGGFTSFHSTWPL